MLAKRKSVRSSQAARFCLATLCSVHDGSDSCVSVAVVVVDDDDDDDDDIHARFRWLMCFPERRLRKKGERRLGVCPVLPVQLLALETVPDLQETPSGPRAIPKGSREQKAGQQE